MSTATGRYQPATLAGTSQAEPTGNPTAGIENGPPYATKTTAGAAYAADPRPTITVSLSGYAGGPTMHLLRSHRFRQMQISFEQGQPDERHLAMLRQAGWTDRRESEGVWTKQIDPNARWQSVARMEQEFKAIANAIRKDRGSGPVLSLRFIEAKVIEVEIHGRNLDDIRYYIGQGLTPWVWEQSEGISTINNNVVSITKITFKLCIIIIFLLFTFPVKAFEV